MFWTRMKGPRPEQHRVGINAPEHIGALKRQHPHQNGELEEKKNVPGQRQKTGKLWFLTPALGQKVK